MEYVHNQSTGTATWNIYHNLNTRNVVVDVMINTVDGMQKVLPQKIQVVSPSSITIAFSQAVAGQARIVTSGGGQGYEFPVFSTSYNIWNQLDLYTFTILSNSNKTMSTNQTGWTGGRAEHFRNYGRFYWEMTTSGLVEGSVWMGIANADWDKIELGSATGINMGIRPAGVHASAFGYNNAILNGSLPFMNNTGVFMFAVDLGPGKFWIGRNGSWFNGNPSTVENPLFNFAPGTYVAPAASVYNSQSSVSLKMSEAEFTYSRPTGFSEWII